MTTELIGIPTAEGTKNIDPAIFAGYKDEAFEHFDTIADGQAKLDGVLDTVVETTGLKKGFVKKYLKARYEEKTKAAVTEGKAFAALDEALA